MNAIHPLTAKSAKVLIRERSNRTLILVSSVLVFCTLYTMWYLSRHQQLRFMTSDAYQKLDFNMKCTSASFEATGDSGIHEKKLQCVPDGAAVDRSSRGLTPSDLLFNKLSTGMPPADEDETSQFAGLLSSLMLPSAVRKRLCSFLRLRELSPEPQTHLEDPFLAWLHRKVLELSGSTHQPLVVLP